MRKLVKALSIISIAALLIGGGAIVSQASASDGWSVAMTANTATEGSNPNLAFGTNAAAICGLDSGIDIPHPPSP